MPLQTKQSTTPDHPSTCLPTNRYPSRCPRSFALCPASCSLSISLPFTPLHSTSPSIPVPQCPFLPQYNPPTHLQLNSSDTPYPPPQPSDAALSPFRSPTSHLPFPSATNKRAPLPAPPAPTTTLCSEQSTSRPLSSSLNVIIQPTRSHASPSRKYQFISFDSTT